MKKCCQLCCLNWILVALCIIRVCDGHPAWLHEKIDGTLTRATLIEIDYTTRVLKVNLAASIPGGPKKQEILKLSPKPRFAVLTSAKLEDFKEFSFVKVEGKAQDRQRSFMAKSLTALPDWFPAEPGIDETTATGVLRRNRTGNLFIQAKRRMTQIQKTEKMQIHHFDERKDLFAIRKGQEILMAKVQENGQQTITAVFVLKESS